MIVLKSGLNGNVARVDDDNRLHTNSKSFFAEEVASQNGRAFIWHSECHLAAATSGGLLAFTSTDQTDITAISRIYIDAHSLTDDIIVYQVKNPTLIGGTDIGANGIVNKNFTQGRTMAGNLVTSDGSADLTYTGGTNYHSFIISSKEKVIRDMRGTNILGNGDVILWGWATLDGGNAVDGEKIALSVNTYLIPTEA
ncbi:MAG: hypothetical protein V3R78_10160 [Thermodesulfobacteriota bacterium]